MGKKLPAARIPVGVARAAGLFFEGVRAVTRVEMPLTRDRVAFMTSDRCYDARKAAEVLGWQAATSLDEGLTRTVAWYRETGLLG